MMSRIKKCDDNTDGRYNGGYALCNGGWRYCQLRTYIIV